MLPMILLAYMAVDSFLVISCVSGYSLDPLIGDIPGLIGAIVDAPLDFFDHNLSNILALINVCSKCLCC